MVPGDNKIGASVCLCHCHHFVEYNNGTRTAVYKQMTNGTDTFNIKVKSYEEKKQEL